MGGLSSATGAREARQVASMGPTVDPPLGVAAGRGAAGSASATSASIEGSELELRCRQLYAELEARGLRSSALLPRRRVVLPRRRARHRHPLLPRSPAAQGARAPPDDGGRGRHARVVRAAPPPRVRPRLRPRVPVLGAPQVARDLRQPRRRLRARDATGRAPTAGASCATCPTGTPRPIPTRTSPRRSPCGSASAGGVARSATAAGRRSRSSSTSTR